MMPTVQVAIETVLVVAPSQNRTALSGMLEGGTSPVAVLHSADCEQALGHLIDSRISVVICEALLPDGNWKDLLARMVSAQASPVLVVTSNVADESLWAEVLNLGGYDVLAQPFDREEVARVVRSAVIASSDQSRRRLADSTSRPAIESHRSLPA
jgi:DNA-binding NtrC family response regulator